MKIDPQPVKVQSTPPPIWLVPRVTLLTLLPNTNGMPTLQTARSLDCKGMKFGFTTQLVTFCRWPEESLIFYDFIIYYLDIIYLLFITKDYLLPPKLTLCLCLFQCNELNKTIEVTIGNKFSFLNNNLHTSSENVICAENWATTNMRIVWNCEAENDNGIVDLYRDHVWVDLSRFMTSDDFW